MKHIGVIIEMDGPSGVGTVVVDGAGMRTLIYAEDCRRVGVEPKVGTRVAYTIGARAGSGVTCAIGLERLGGAPAPAAAAAPAPDAAPKPATPAAPVLQVVPKPPA